jgi:hypothetical protein
MPRPQVGSEREPAWTCVQPAMDVRPAVEALAAVLADPPPALASGFHMVALPLPGATLQVARRLDGCFHHFDFK